LTLIRPTFVENLFHTLFSLEMDRPQYYLFVIRLGRSIFMSLGFDGSSPEFPNKVGEMEELIRQIVEIPLESTYVSVLHAYYNPRFYLSKRAYTYIGEGLDQREVTRYEIMMRFEYIKDWVYDSVMELTPLVRFTRPTQMIT
jgi:hypothetical protein